MSMQIMAWMRYKIPTKLCSLCRSGTTTEVLARANRELGEQYKLGRRTPEFAAQMSNILSMIEIDWRGDQLSGNCLTFAQPSGFMYAKWDDKKKELVQVDDVTRVMWTSPGLAEPCSELACGSLSELQQQLQDVINSTNQEILAMQNRMALAQSGRGILPGR